MEVLDTARVKVFFEGMIQGVGFRSVVKHTAMSLGVKGLVRNLEDGRVEAFFDGEMGKVEKLLRALDIKGKENDPFSLNVSRMVTHWEGSEGYTPAWRAYRRFDVDYGMREPDARYEDEIIDSLEVAKSSFTMLRASLDEFRVKSKDGFKGLRGDVSELHGDVKTGFTGLRGDISELRGEVKTGFTGLKGDISELRGDVKTGFKGLRGDVAGLRDDMKTGFKSLKESMDSGHGTNTGVSKQNEDPPQKLQKS